jgi:hypothetical protein
VRRSPLDGLFHASRWPLLSHAAYAETSDASPSSGAIFRALTFGWTRRRAPLRRRPTPSATGAAGERACSTLRLSTARCLARCGPLHAAAALWSSPPRLRTRHRPRPHRPRRTACQVRPQCGLIWRLLRHLTLPCQGPRTATTCPRRGRTA